MSTLNVNCQTLNLLATKVNQEAIEIHQACKKLSGCTQRAVYAIVWHTMLCFAGGEVKVNPCII